MRMRSCEILILLLFVVYTIFPTQTRDPTSTCPSKPSLGVSLLVYQGFPPRSMQAMSLL